MPQSSRSLLPLRVIRATPCGPFPPQRYTLYSRCNCGSLDSIQDATGNVTSFFYDNAGRLINTVYPDGFSITNNFNLLGQLTNRMDSAGASITNSYNNQGLPRGQELEGSISAEVISYIIDSIIA